MITLPAYPAQDSGIDRLPVDRLQALQGERLRAMVEYVYDRTTFWRARLDAAGVRPGDIRGLDDLSRLPFCTRSDIEADQLAHPPFGSYLAADRSTLVKFMTTSGTTGRPLVRVFSGRDWGLVLDRFLRTRRIEPGDTVVMCGPVDGLLGPTAAADSAAHAGALVVLAGLYDSRSKVRMIERMRPRMVSGTATYLLHLADVAREIGVDLRALQIATVVSAGEPGAAIPATRQRLVDAWGAFVSDGYGLTELFPLGGGCPHSTSLHIASDFVITEIVDPDTGVPVTPGDPGEVVYTNLVGETQPLLRYRTRDVARMATDGPCLCGFTGARLRDSIEGRLDDMIWYRGVNVFPSAIEAVVRSMPELADEYEIVVEGERALPTITVRVETRPNLDAAARSDVETRLRRALAAAIRVAPRIELLSPGSLPVTVRAKRRRVVDRRSPRNASTTSLRT